MVRELPDRHRAAEALVDLALGVTVDVQHIRLAVADAEELVAHVDRLVEGQLAARELAEDRQQHGQLHRRGGVEDRVRVVRPLQRGLAVVERNAEALELVALADGEDARVERLLRLRDGCADLRLGLRLRLGHLTPYSIAPILL